MTGCEFNQEGFCVVVDEFPEMKDAPCPFNKDGKCTAKDSDLTYVCPDCYRENCEENCGVCSIDEKLYVPKTVSPKEAQEKTT